MTSAPTRPSAHAATGRVRPFAPPAQVDARDLPHLPTGRTQVYKAERLGDDPRPDGAVRSGNRFTWWLVLPMFLLAAAPSYIGSNREMWIDEYVTAYVTRLSWDDFTHLLHNQDLVHGLYYILMREWTLVFGHSLLALRTPSMIGMGVAAASVAILGRRLHSTPVGVAAGLFFVALPIVSRYGQEVRSYAWVVALAALATIALLAALERNSGTAWSRYALLLIAIGYLHFAALLIMLPHAILAFTAWRRSRDGELVRWLVSAVVAVAVTAPLLYFASKQSAQVDWIQSDWAAVQRYPIELFGSMNVFYAIVALGLIGAVRFGIARPGITVALLGWALVPPAFDYATTRFDHLFLAKYALFTLPAWALLAAGLFAPTRRQIEGTGATVAIALRWTGVAVATVGLAAAGFTAQKQIRQSPLAGEPDFRAAAAVVDAGYQTGDGIVYVGTYRFARIPFDYELKRATPNDLYAAVDPATNGWFYPQGCVEPVGCLDNAPRIWLVVSNYSNDDYYGLSAGESDPLKRLYEKTTTSKFDSIRVVLLVHKTTD